MKIAVFLNALGLGGTEKAACRWALGLKERGHQIRVLVLADGPRRKELEGAGIGVSATPSSPAAIADALRNWRPEVIHAHAPGYPHPGDLLGAALATLPRIPVVQTNIFGRLDNPPEDRWTDFRLFISWTSCVQAAQRSFHPLDEKFFRRASVASYPLDPDDGPPPAAREQFRRDHGVAAEEILFGRFSRPEPNKWTDLPLAAFRLGLARNRRLKFLLREPPPEISRQLRASSDYDRFLILPATDDALELRLTMASLDAVLHTSSIGESFGYGIAEPMNYAKPAIANSTPWQDQAQIELVRPGEGGFIASQPEPMAARIFELAGNEKLRLTMGLSAQRHIRQLADPVESITRLEGALQCVIDGRDNPRAAEDAARAHLAANYLQRHQFGHSWREQIALRPLYYRVRFHQARRRLRQSLGI